MAKVQFVTECKYNGIKYPAHTPFMVNDEDLTSLRQSGAIVLEGISTPIVQTEPEPVVSDVSDTTVEDSAAYDIHKMTVAELKSFASHEGIDIKGVEKKADILDIVSAALNP